MNSGEQLYFPGSGLQLEGRLAIPLHREAAAGVVLCHPHPLHGGTMDNNVIHAVTRALVERGVAVLRFNFRGVGRSGGVHDGGRGEIDDALAAVDFLAGCSTVDSGRLGLAGYSFGGAIALSAAIRSSRIRAVAAVSPPEIPDLGSCGRPRLVLCGSKDRLIPVASILEHKDAITGPDAAGVLEVIRGADHFWHGHEGEVANRVADFFQQYWGLLFPLP